jgi:hypothetical protein
MEKKMEATIKSTDQIVDVKAIGHSGLTKARVWEGVTAAGVRFTAYIPIVQVHKDDDNVQFERELSEHKQPENWTARAIEARFF